MTPKWYGLRAVLICVVGLSVSCTDSSGPGVGHFELAFTRSDKGGSSSDVYVSRADGSHTTRVATAGGAGTARWSPDGRTIAFVNSTSYSANLGSNTIELVASDGSGRSTLTEGTDPAWSPDGTQIGFTGYTEVIFPTGGGKATKIFQVNTIKLDGSNQILLTPDTAYNAMGSWSPDATRIVFTRFTPAIGNDQIFIMAVDGTSLVQLTYDVARKSKPIWSPTGAKILYEGWEAPHSAVYTMNADGSDQTRLTSGAADDFCPAWSPDGTRIAFTSNRDGFFQTYLMNADGSDQVRIQSNFSDTCPSWKSP
jgi:Tol biopolymer transport system component